MNRRLQLVFFAAGLAFFGFLIARTGAHTILASLARTGWMFVPIVAVWGAVYVTNTIAWLLIVAANAGEPMAATPEDTAGDTAGDTAEARGIPFARAYAISVSSFAINYITPMVSLGGEPFRFSAAATWIAPRRAAASVVAFRVLHTLGQFLFWLLALPVAYAFLPRTAATRAGLAAVAVVLLVATVLLALLLQARVLERWLDVLHGTPLLRRAGAALEPRRPALIAIDTQLATLARERPGHLAGALLAEVGGRFIAMLEFYLIARSIGVALGYGTAVVIGAFSQLVLNLLFFIPFELGAKEGGLYLIFELLGLSPDLGIATAIVSRLRELAWVGIGLLLIWATGARGRLRDEGAVPTPPHPPPAR